MKKLFILLFGISIISSCSNDSNIDFNEVSTSVNSEAQDRVLKSGADQVLKDLYITMINSQSYKNYNTALEEFDAKLGRYIPDSEMGSSASMLQWISGNISQTGFNSYADALGQYENVQALHSVSLQSNIRFFEYFAGKQPGTLIPIIEEQQPITNACKPCENAYTMCVGEANSAYTSAIQSSSAQWLENRITMPHHNMNVSHAVHAHIRAIARCTSNFEECCGGGA